MLVYKLILDNKNDEDESSDKHVNTNGMGLKGNRFVLVSSDLCAWLQPSFGLQTPKLTVILLKNCLASSTIYAVSYLRICC